MNDELTPASMEAAIRPFYEPCERRLREWVESNYVTTHVSRLDLKRVMQEYDRRGAIKQAAAAYIKSCLCNGGTDAPELNADISAKWRALTDAVEGGDTVSEKLEVESNYGSVDFRLEACEPTRQVWITAGNWDQSITGTFQAEEMAQVRDWITSWLEENE